jgi:hypothetical protein
MCRKALFRLGLMAFVVMLAAAPAAQAQVVGLYYQEVEKDGQIYVFNTPERYKAWSESGEMGTAITLVGRGPDGETVVADNETALDLFFFKHDLPGYDRPTPEPKSVEDYVTYKDGKLGFKFKGGQISLSNRVQVRYTYLDNVGAGVEDIGSFRIRRAKTAIEGKIYEDWKFKLQASWVGGNVVEAASLSGGALSTTVSRGTVLEDAEIWYTRNPLATPWIGQGKAFFGRQELTSSARQQFVDRTLFSGRFHPGRDQGLGLIGATKGKTFEYNVGIYNGNILNRSANDNKEYMTLGRVVWTPLGEFKLDESATDYQEKPKLALGVGLLENTLGRRTATANSKVDISRANVEAAFKWRSFSAVGEYAEETSEPQATGVETDTDGYYVQVGYLFPNRRFELAARTSEFSSDGVISSGFPELEEQGLAATWYLAKHNHKISADYTEIERNTGSGPLDTSEIRLQLQLVF